MGVLGGTEVSRYTDLVRWPDGNHLGYPYWDKVMLLIYLNVRTQLHNVFNNHKS